MGSIYLAPPKAREVPGIEMDITFREQVLPNGKILLTIDTTVKNTSVLPIRPLIQQAMIVVEKRPLPEDEAILGKEINEENHMFRRPLCPNVDEITLEPNTLTVFSDFFAAEPNTLYAVFVSIPYRESQPGEHTEWNKLRLHYVPTSPR